jgi:hypothetical protein
MARITRLDTDRDSSGRDSFYARRHRQNGITLTLVRSEAPRSDKAQHEAQQKAQHEKRLPKNALGFQYLRGPQMKDANPSPPANKISNIANMGLI